MDDELPFKLRDWADIEREHYGELAPTAENHLGYKAAAEIERLTADRDRLQDAIRCAKDLIEVVRMPNIEYVADAHNAAVKKLRTILEEHSK